jgi:hypothetical protein
MGRKRLDELKQAIASAASTIEETEVPAADEPDASQTISLDLPPQDRVQLTLPKGMDESKSLHFRLPMAEGSTMLGELDAHKRTQAAHISYSQIPVLYAFVHAVDRRDVEAVLHPFQAGVSSVSSTPAPDAHLVRRGGRRGVRGCTCARAGGGVQQVGSNRSQRGKECMK